MIAPGVLAHEERAHSGDVRGDLSPHIARPHVIKPCGGGV